MQTKTKMLQRIVNDYIEAGGEWPATSRQVAGWAVRERRWQPHPASLVSQCAEDLATAMREEYIKDKQGRPVRAKHAARIKQEVLWADIRSASREHMDIAFKWRRRLILGDCHQLRLDLDYFNEQSAPMQPVQMSYDFTNDLLEMEALEKSEQSVA